MAGAPILVLVTAALYLAFADLSGWRERVERAGGDALGIDLSLNGRFEPRLVSLSPGLALSDVSIGDPGGGESAFVHVESLAVEVAATPLLSGRVVVRQLRLRGITVRLVHRLDSPSSWELGGAGEGEDQEPRSAPEDFPVRLEHVIVDGLNVIYEPAGAGKATSITLDRLELGPDPEERLPVQASARVEEVPVSVSGRIPRLGRMTVQGTRVHLDLHGRINEASFSLSGTLEDLHGLSGADLRLEAEGEDLRDLTDLMGTSGSASGPFSLMVSVRPAGGRLDAELRASLGGSAFEVRGQIGSLLDPAPYRFNVSASGPDLSGIAAPLGVERIPAETFQVDGVFRSEDGLPFIEKLVMESAGHRASIEGVPGAPPSWETMDLAIDASGGNLAELSAAAGADLPAGEYSLSGRILGEAEGFRLQGLQAATGAISVEAAGLLGMPPALAGTDLEIEARGPDLAALGPLAGASLPGGPFDAAARMEVTAGSVELTGARFDLAGHTAEGEVLLDRGSFPAGTRIRAEAKGPDLADAGDRLSLEGLPAVPYQLTSSLVAGPELLRFESLSARAGESDVELSGRMALGPGLQGTDLDLRISGTDLSLWRPAAGLPDLPAGPFEAGGGLGIDGDGYTFEEMIVAMGGLRAKVDGRLGPGPGFRGTDLQIRAEGPAPSALERWIDLPPLPGDPFTVSGRLQMDGEAYRLGRAAVDLGADRLTADGAFGAGGAWGETDLRITARGPDLSRYGPLIGAESGRVPGALPREKFTLEGRLLGHPEGYRIREAVLTAAGARLEAEGTIGTGSALAGTDLAVSGRGPDGSMLSPVLGGPVPARPFQVSGEVGVREDLITLRDLSIILGEMNASLDGTLGGELRQESTLLSIAAGGPSLADAGRLAGWDGLPDEPFSLEARLAGEPRKLTLSDLEARVGRSDVTGWISREGGSRVTVEGRLQSDFLGLTPWLTGGEEDRPGEAVSGPEDKEPEEATSTGAAAQQTDREQATAEPDGEPDPAPPSGARELLIPDTPFPEGLLGRSDVDITWEAREVDVINGVLRDARARLYLKDGSLRIHPFSASGAEGGSLEGWVSLEPHGSARHLEASLKMDGMKLGLLAAGEDPEHQSPTNVELEISGDGATPHEIAASADGRILVVQGKGRIDLSILDILALDLVSKIFDALNPFNEKLPYTQLQCVVILGNLKKGRMEFESLAMRTDRVTVVGSGEIQFSDEELDLEWTAKPRKGIGLSVGGLTNPYVKVGGTLADPGLTIKPLDSVVSTGAAILTGGLSFLAKGVWDRITATRDVCENALEEAREQLQETVERIEEARRERREAGPEEAP